MKHVVAWGHGVGLFSMFTQVMTVFDVFPSENKIVHWNANSLYWEPDGWNGARHNVWEYYFEPTSNVGFQSLIKGEYQTHKLNTWSDFHNKWLYNNDYTPIIPELENLTVAQAQSLVDKEEVYITSGHMNRKTGWGGAGWSESDRPYLKKLIDSYVRVKPAVMAKVDAFYNEHMAGRRVVGIHFRGTDKHTELMHIGDYDGKGERPIGEYLKTLNSIDKDALVYLATDCQKAFDISKMYLGGRLLSHKGWYRSVDNTNPYLKRHKSNKALHGEQVIMDWLLLSKCDYFIHGFSNMSATALFMNPTMPHFNVYRDRI